MQTTFTAIDGKVFTNKREAAMYEAKLETAKSYFIKLVKLNFFPRIKIKPFYHNHTVESLGRITESSWNDRVCGYCLVGGRMGNSNTYIRFKIRGNKTAKKDSRKLLIFKYQGDNDTNERWKYFLTLKLAELDLEYKLQERIDTFIDNYNAKPIAQQQARNEEIQAALSKLTEREIQLLKIRL